MSWSERLPRRRLLGLGMAGLLAGCGFSPVYAPGGGAEALRGQIAVEAPATDEGFVLRQHLLDRLGRGAAPAYELSVDLETGQSAVATTSEQATQRYHVTGTASYSLTEIASGRERLSGTVDSFTAYSATGTAVSTTAARRDARDRLAVALGDLIVKRLLLAAPELP